VVYLAHTLDDLGEFVLNFEEEVEEFLRQLRDKTCQQQGQKIVT